MASRKRNKAGNAKRRVILEAAAQILITSGHHNLTMRKVSDAVGISVGNLTYHFPNKIGLIEELIRDTLDNYLAEFEKILTSKNANFKGDLKELINWVLIDAVDETVARFFRELWVMSAHYPPIAETFSDYYKTGVQKMVNLFIDYFPNAPKKDLKMAIYILAIIVEGTGIVFGGNARLDVHIEEVIPEITEIFEDYLFKKDIST